jgi:cytidyltransferase-like protein
MASDKKPIVVAVSGYFNPLHVGHLKMLEDAKKLGNILVAIVNSDAQVKLKGSVPFMHEKDRMRIVNAIGAVDRVVLSIDKDRTVCRTLAHVRPDIFANGGDRASARDIPEDKICRKLGIRMIFGVGGKKIISSSGLIKDASKNHFINNAVTRPWGSYNVLLENPGYKIKEFIVMPGQTQSLQMHQHRSEHWVVVVGQAHITHGNQTLVLKAGQSTFIPLGAVHRVANLTRTLLKIIEVQRGDYLGEDDIIRFDDEYGRT